MEFLSSIFSLWWIKCAKQIICTLRLYRSYKRKVISVLLVFFQSLLYNLEFAYLISILNPGELTCKLAQQFLEVGLPFAFSFAIILHIEDISQNPLSFYTLKWPYLLIDACSHEWCVDKFLLGDDMEVGESLHIKVRENIWG